MENYKIYLDNILKNMPGAIYWKDSNGVYKGCNEFEAKIARLNAPEQMIGKTDYELLWNKDADTLRKTDKRIMETGIAEALVESVQFLDKTKLVMLTNKAPLYDDNGKIIGIIGTSLDITARVEAEEREQAALRAQLAAEAQSKIGEEVKRAIMVLAGSIAHDLRTPLITLSMVNARLKNYLLMVLASIQPDDDLSLAKSQAMLDDLSNIPNIIDELMKNMHQFIDHNLKAIKHCQDSTIKEEALVVCKSYKAINNAINSYPFKSGEKKLLQTDTNFYFDFLGNPVLFLRILFNLINNSLHQIQKMGKGQIFISCEQALDHNIIRFKDTAGGAPISVVEHIFDGYVTTKEHGTGIGLAFCKLTMESFGGTIECHAQDGDFIEFILKFPKIIE